MTQTATKTTTTTVAGPSVTVELPIGNFYLQVADSPGDANGLYAQVLNYALGGGVDDRVYFR